MIDLEAIKTYAAEVSTKPIKANARDKVSFKFKDKKKKPISATGVCLFTIFGEDLPVERIAEMLEGQGIVELE